MNRFAIVVAAAIAGAAASPAPAAEVIYKSSSADGSITYSATPVPDALTSETLQVKALSPEKQRAALRLLKEEGQALERDYATRERAWNKADREIIDATRALSRAELALQKGRAPLPGERRGNVGGGSRLSARYFDRLHGLESGVLRAKRRLDEAYRVRNDLRG